MQLLANEPEYRGRSDQDLIIEEGRDFDLLDDGFRFGGADQYRVHEDRQAPDSTRLALPALALPLTEKTQFACPEAHIEALRSDLEAVTRVLVVGWRASELHFLTMWKEALAATNRPAPQADVISGSGFSAVRRNLEACGIHVRAPEQSTFSDFVSEGLDQFLRDL